MTGIMFFLFLVLINKIIAHFNYQLTLFLTQLVIHSYHITEKIKCKKYFRSVATVCCKFTVQLLPQIRLKFIFPAKNSHFSFLSETFFSLCFFCGTLPTNTTIHVGFKKTEKLICSLG